MDAEPLRPGEDECCGSGCNPCILDIYQQELELAKKTTSATSSHLNTETYTNFELTDIIQHTESTNLYRFRLADKEKLGHKAGQHVIVKQIHPYIADKTMTRQYSVLSSPSQTGNFDLLIKIYQDGLMSSAIRNWKIHDTIPMRGPFGQVDVDQLLSSIKSDSSKVVYICQGTGLVPGISLLQQILEDEEVDQIIQAFYSVRCTKEILMQNEISKLCDYWNFRLTMFIKETVNTEFRLYGPNKKYVNEKLSSKYLEFPDFERCRFILCGSKDFMKNIHELLTEKGAKNENIMKL